MSKQSIHQNKLISLLKQAIAHHQNNNFSEAEKFYADVLKIDPRNFDALHNLGLLKFSQNKFEAAEPLFKKAILVNGNHYMAYFNLGNTQRGLQKLEDAINSFKKTLSLSPNFIDGLMNLGVTFKEANQTEQALICYEKALAINPGNSAIHFNKGNAEKNSELYEEALISFNKVVEIEPSRQDAYVSCAIVLINLERYEEALERCNQAILLNSSYAEAFLIKGNALMELQKTADASMCYEKAIEINPSYAEAYLNKGNVLRIFGKYQEAIQTYEKAIECKGNYYEAYLALGRTYAKNNEITKALEIFSAVIELDGDYPETYLAIAGVLEEDKKIDEAINFYKLASQKSPNDAEALFNLGRLQAFPLKKYDEALITFEKVYQLSPDLSSLANIINTKMQTANWYDVADQLKLATSGNLGAKGLNPFNALSYTDDPKFHLAVAKSRFEEEIISQSSFKTKEFLQKTKIRVGYFSADFKTHPVGRIMVNIIENHDRELFEIYGFSLQKDDPNDPIRVCLANSFDKLIHLEALSDLAAIAVAQDLDLDIAIDLSVYTGGCRPTIFAARVAPIQVNYLGFTGSTAAPYIDYIMADKIVIPEDDKDHFTEKVAYLPSPYMANNLDRLLPDIFLKRSDFHLPDDAFVFCCFNNAYKFTKDYLLLWSTILHKVENSVLWIAKNNDFFKKNILIEFGNQGIDINRIIFADYAADHVAHIARLSLADLFLDTFPFCAQSTALDSVNAGLPILTRPGRSFTSRVSSSILSALDCPELITQSDEEYISMAVELASEPELLLQIRNKIKINFSKSSLGKVSLSTRNIENAYKHMHQRYLNNLSPDHFSVEIS